MILEKIKGWKKISAAVMSLLIAVLQDIIGLDANTAQTLIQSLWVYIGAQGIADAGKYAGEAAKK